MEVINIIIRLVICFCCGWAVGFCIVSTIYIKQIRKSIIKLCDAFSTLSNASSTIADDNIKLINMIKNVLKENKALECKIKKLEANK